MTEKYLLKQGMQFIWYMMYFKFDCFFCVIKFFSFTPLYHWSIKKKPNKTKTPNQTNLRFSAANFFSYEDYNM